MASPPCVCVVVSLSSYVYVCIYAWIKHSQTNPTHLMHTTTHPESSSRSRRHNNEKLSTYVDYVTSIQYTYQAKCTQHVGNLINHSTHRCIPFPIHCPWYVTCSIESEPHYILSNQQMSIHHMHICSTCICNIYVCSAYTTCMCM